MKLVIPGELADLNTFISDLKASRWRGQRVKNEETDRVAWLTKAQRLQTITEYPVEIKYTWYLKDKRKDLDNIAFAKKFVNDGLVRGGILENDGQKQIAGFRDIFIIDKNNPRVEIEISKH